jgi:hypothetical protein
MNALVIGLLIAIVVLNAFVTVWLMRTEYLLPNQKLAQALVVWLVPLLGALGIAVVLYSNRERPHVRSNHILLICTEN